MAKKPDAARGKTTRKGRVKKIFEKLRQQAKGKKTTGMSPGAMGGRTKPKLGPAAALQPGKKLRAPLRRSPSPQRKQLQGMLPMTGAARSTIKGAGASGAAMSGQAMKLARQLKKTGRLNVDDIKRAKKILMNRKGK
tara:strand:+ start:277 stop:687 length:411 start_codon:yes stop_codon:yes gene_type:complete